MAARQVPPATTLLFFAVLTLVFIVVLSAQAFGSIWIGLAAMVIVVAIPILFYLGRPSVREGFGLLFTLRAGNRALARGDYVQAEGCLRSAISRAEHLREGRDAFLGTALCQLGEVYRVQGRLAEAEPIFAQAIRHFTEATPYQPTQRAVAVHGLAAVYIQQGRHAEAEPLCREALNIFVNAGSPHRAVALIHLGKALAGQGKDAEAEEVTRRGHAADAGPTR